jgi:hypothetical protein
MAIEGVAREVVAVLVGAGAGYGFGFLQAVLDRRRQRRAVATALLHEFARAADLAVLLRDDPQPGNLRVFLRGPAQDRFIDHVALLKPATAAAVLDAVDTAVYLRGGWNEPEGKGLDAGHAKHGAVRTLALTLLEQLRIARRLLRDAGGVEPLERPKGPVRADVEPRDDRPPLQPRMWSV